MARIGPQRHRKKYTSCFFYRLTEHGTYHVDGVHSMKHTVTVAVLRTPTNETPLLEEENCCILYVLILFNVWNFTVSFRITYGKTMMSEVLLEQFVIVYVVY